MEGQIWLFFFFRYIIFKYFLTVPVTLLCCAGQGSPSVTAPTLPSGLWMLWWKWPHPAPFWTCWCTNAAWAGACPTPPLRPNSFSTPPHTTLVSRHTHYSSLIVGDIRVDLERMEKYYRNWTDSLYKWLFLCVCVCVCMYECTDWKFMPVLLNHLHCVLFFFFFFHF